MSIDLIARIPTTPDNFERVERALEHYAEVVRRESGNERFEIYASDDGVGGLIVIERYTDRNAFAAHLAAPENALLNESLRRLTGGDGSHLEMLHRLV